MNDQHPVIALVHGAFAESASWNGVIERLQAKGLDAIAIGNPLRGLTIDATYVRDVITMPPYEWPTSTTGRPSPVMTSRT